MIALCSKTYLLRDGDECKFSSKGMNKCSLKNPIAQYEAVLTDEQPGSAVNKGFRLRGNYMHTYQESRSGLSYFYCKREVNDDGIRTKPLDLVISPWNIPDYYGFCGDKDPLSSYYPCQLVLYGRRFYNAAKAYEFRLKSVNELHQKTHINESELPEKWLAIRNEVMKEILTEKINVNEAVRKSLRESKCLNLVYCTRNKYWGIGMQERVATVTTNYRGKNMLGSIWEELRESKWSEINSTRVERCADCKVKRTDVKYRKEEEQKLCTMCSIDEYN